MPFDIRQWAQERQQRRAEQQRQQQPIAPGGGNAAQTGGGNGGIRAGNQLRAGGGTQQGEQEQATPVRQPGGWGDIDALTDQAMSDLYREEEERRRQEKERRDTTRRQQDEAQRRLAGLTADEVSNASQQRQQRRDRNESLVERIMAGAYDDLDARGQYERERDSETNALVNDILRQAYDLVDARDAYERDARTNELVDDIMDQTYDSLEQQGFRRPSDVIDDIDVRDQYEKEINAEAAARRGEISRQRRRHEIQSVLDELPDGILDMLAEAGVDIEGMDIDEIVSMLRELRRDMMREELPEMPSRSDYIASRVRDPAMPTTSEYAERWADATQAYTEEQARQRGERTGMRDYDPDNIPFYEDVDAPYNEWTDVTNFKGSDSEVYDMLMESASHINDAAYETMREREGNTEGTGVDDQARGLGGIDFNPSKGESYHKRILMQVRNAMLNRFLNPALLRIDGKKVEFRETVDKRGSKHREARLTYDDEVIKEIGKVRQLYDCTFHNVLQLVMLRGGIGIDAKGLIAGVDPNKFELTKDQFIELCEDICSSQEANGHPLGPVAGKPGNRGVRDDSGKYVVVAGTRCFPLGYMPSQLVADLSRNHVSPLHGLSERQIQKMIGNTWLQTTYPELLANTTGVQTFQARAIENMMRGLMMADGVAPSGLDIPDIVDRKNLMMLQAEGAGIGDQQVRDSHEQILEDYERSREIVKRRYWKETKQRDADGNVVSSSVRRRRTNMGDMVGWVSMTERTAQSASLPIMLTSPIEETVGEIEQMAALGLTNFYIQNADRRDANGERIPVEQYRYTPQLNDIASQKASSESLEVANAIYRIGGHPLLDVFLNEKNPGSEKGDRWTLTKDDMHRFLIEYGIISESSNVPRIITDKLRQVIGLKPTDDAFFLSNAQNVLDSSENIMLSNGIFDGRRTRMYVRVAMTEMAQARIYGGRSSFTSDEVAAWGMGETGGEEMIHSLLKTDAGREAFMTEGATGLGRKSLVEYGVRQMLAANRVTEWAVRNFFDRFPEYGLQKSLEKVPMSHTIGFLNAWGIRKVGDVFVAIGEDSAITGTGVADRFVSMGKTMRRATNYEMGGRMTFKEGLRKNLLYDTMMAGGRIAIGCVYYKYIMHLGGIRPPKDQEDRYTWSEWLIGGEAPLKWSWFMDDLSGIGLPLGVAYAICESGGWSSEAKQDAANVFINAICNLDNGTAVFDAIDLINNWDEEVDTFFGGDLELEGQEAPSEWDKAQMAVTLGFWNTLGNMTPAVVEQLCPWSRDYLFKSGTDDAHTPYKIYASGRESKYSMEEATDEYRVKDATWRDALIRRASQSNILLALGMNFLNFARGNKDATGYLYTQMPLDTMPEPYMMNGYYDRFYLNLDPSASVEDGGGIPIDDKEAREAELDRRAEMICDHVSKSYNSAEEAFGDGFVLNFEARVNCINYCYKKIDEAWDTYRQKLKEAKLASGRNYAPDDVYQQLVDNREDVITHYKGLLETYFNFGNVIPWRVPRYVRQESDTETRYVDESGNAGTYLGTIGALRNNEALKNTLRGLGEWGQIAANAIGDNETHADPYAYGNYSGIMPNTTPITQGKGYNNETIPPFVYLDENGNPINDMQSVYDDMGEMPAVSMGRFAGNDLQEQYFAGQGNNLKDDVKESMNISPDGTPTMSERNWRIMDEILPDELAEMLKDPDKVSELLGVESHIPDPNAKDDKSSSDDTTDTTTGKTGNRSGGNGGNGGGYYNRSYSGGGRRRTYSYSSGNSEYNPRIYSNARQVNGSRASGLSTRQPYKATTTYLRPAFYTSGSRTSYRRQQ